jgi:sec-independent protein translocase protein TatA
MPSVGPLELIIVLVIALVVFGPKRLPQLGRQLGSGMREFKDSITGDNKHDDDDEDARPALTRAEAPTATGAPAPAPADAAHEPAEEPAVRPQS